VHQLPTKLTTGLPLLDVRSPSEYAKGHIPGAVSLPLFSDQERHEVGLAYKTLGRNEAVKLGLGFVGPKMRELVTHAEALAPERKVQLYCWRGGMRSGSVSWLLRTAGFEVQCIAGGYKTWRRQVLALFEYPFRFICLGGYTGVGKTAIIEALRSRGEQVINLEALASHRGSAFGTMGTQPANEHFENLLAEALLRLDPVKPVWIEDESRRIGKIFLPHALLSGMRAAPYVLLHRDTHERIREVCAMYGFENLENLTDAFRKIEKRMGGQYCIQALEALHRGDLEEAARLALHYYDRSYAHTLEVRKIIPTHTVDVSGNMEETADSLITWKNQNSLNSATARVAGAK